MKQFVLHSCFYLLPWHTNKITDEGFNLFDECAARCVHLFPQEEECTSSSWGNSKMYTSSSMANSQRMLTEINKSDVITQIRIWVEFDTVKTIRIISSEMKISLLILRWCFHIIFINKLQFLIFHFSDLQKLFKSRLFLTKYESNLAEHGFCSPSLYNRVT